MLHLLQQMLSKAVFRVAHHAHKLGLSQLLEVPADCYINTVKQAVT